jgi:hypothetical protein
MIQHGQQIRNPTFTQSLTFVGIYNPFPPPNVHDGQSLMNNRFARQDSLDGVARAIMFGANNQPPTVQLVHTGVPIDAQTLKSIPLLSNDPTLFQVSESSKSSLRDGNSYNINESSPTYTQMSGTRVNYQQELSVDKLPPDSNYYSQAITDRALQAFYGSNLINVA